MTPAGAGGVVRTPRRLSTRDPMTRRPHREPTFKFSARTIPNRRTSDTGSFIEVGDDR
jgi:hypothetical protein